MTMLAAGLVGALATMGAPLTGSRSGPELATITSGTIFTGTDGKPVHAHGAGIVLPHTHPAGKDGTFFMVGATQKIDFSGWLSEGINMYSSTDLQHWTLVNEIFHNTSITTPIPEGQSPSYRIERYACGMHTVSRQALTCLTAQAGAISGDAQSPLPRACTFTRAHTEGAARLPSVHATALQAEGDLQRQDEEVRHVLPPRLAGLQDGHGGRAPGIDLACARWRHNAAGVHAASCDPAFPARTRTTAQAAKR